MTIESVAIEVEMLGKIYNIKCPQDQKTSLQQAAHHLEEQLDEIRKTNNIVSLERLAMITALNITHKLLTLEQEKNQSTQVVNQRLRELHNKLETLLAENAQLEFHATP